MAVRLGARVSIELIATVFAIAVIDSINLSSLAMTGYFLTLVDPWSQIRAYIAGIFMMYLSAGLLLVFAFDESIDGLPMREIARGVEALIGVAAVAFAIRRPRTARRVPDPVERTMSSTRAFGLGLTATAVDLTTALPYLGAIAVIGRAGTSHVGTVVLLVAYNVIFVFPSAALAFSVRYRGAGPKQRLERAVQATRRRASGRRGTARLGCLVAGLALIAHAALSNR